MSTAVTTSNPSQSFEWLFTADLDAVREHAPDLVPEIENIIKTIDLNNPISIPQAGKQYREKLRTVGLEASTAISKITDAGALNQVSEFRAALEKSLGATTKKLSTKEKAKELASTAGNKVLGMLHKAGAAIGVFKAPDGIPTSEEIEARMDELRADAKELNEFVSKTVKDAMALDAGISVSEKQTEVVAEQAVRLREAHKTAAQGLLLTLVATRTVKKGVTTEISDLEKDASALAPEAISEYLQRQLAAKGWLERAETDLIAAISRQALQRNVLDNLEIVNLNVATELAVVRETVLPSVSEMITTMRMQQATAQAAAITGAAHGIMRDATMQTATGLDRTMQITYKATESRQAAIAAIPDAIREVIGTVEGHREYLALASQRETVAQESLAKGLGDLTKLAQQTGLLKAETGQAALSGPTRDEGTDIRLIGKNGPPLEEHKR